MASNSDRGRRSSPCWCLGRPDCIRVSRTASVLPAASDRHQFVGPGTKVLAQIINQQVNAAILSDDPRQNLAVDWL